MDVWVIFGGIGLLYAPKKSCLSVTSKSPVPIFDAVCARVLICVCVCLCVCLCVCVCVGGGHYLQILRRRFAGKGRALKCLGDELIHSVHWGIDPSPSKKSTPLFFCQASPLKSANCSSTPLSPFIGNCPLYIGFSWTLPPPVKILFFSEPP